MDVRVFAQHHVGVEDAVGVEQALQLPHQLVGVMAPFQLHERCHVAPGAVLGLERAAELHRHQLRHIVHEGLVAGDFLGTVEALGEDEVQVAFQGMAENDRFVVAVLVEQLDQAVDAFGQLLDGEGDVFDDHRGAGLAHGADGGEGVLADFPQLVVYGWVFAEVHLLFQREVGDRGHHLLQLFMQQALAGGAGLDQQGAGIVRQAFYPHRHAGHVLHRTQAAAVEQLHGRDRLALEYGYRAAAAFHAGEHQQGAGLVRVVGHGVVGDGTDEAQGAFGTDQQVLQDIQRLVVVHQCVQRQASGVLQPVFVPDALGECSVGAGLAAQAGQCFQQVGVAGLERGDAGRVFAVQARAVGQHQAQAGQGVVGVLRGAAAHAAGVVGDDAADLAGVDRGRVGADLAPEGGQPGVGLGADDAGLQADLLALAADFAAVPVIAQHDQHRVADGLAGQAGAGGAEGDRHPLALGQFDQADHFVLGLDAYHQLGDKPVEAGVGAEGQGGGGVVEAAFGGDQALGITQERGGQAHAVSSRGRGVCAPHAPGQSGGRSCGRQAPSSRTSESRVISLIDLAPVSTIATRISFSNSSSRFFTPAWPCTARA
ncbi:hypothetical protein D3C78_625500 [compost metagenome]